MMAEDKTKRNRSKKWSLDEKMVLINSVEKNYGVLFGKCTNDVTDVKKRQLWLQITENINACSTTKRTVDKVRDQFRHVKSETKAKAAKLLRETNKTGGGDPQIPDMDTIEEKLCSLMDWERKLIKLIGMDGVIGIPDGIDSTQLEKNAENTPGIESPSHQQLVSEDFQDVDEHFENTFNVTTDPQSSTQHDSGENKENETVHVVKKQDTKKRKSADDLLDTQRDILHQLTRIADASEERNRLKKYKLGLCIDTPFPLREK